MEQSFELYIWSISPSPFFIVGVNLMEFHAGVNAEQLYWFLLGYAGLPGHNRDRNLTAGFLLLSASQALKPENW